MLDIRFILDNTVAVRENVKARNVDADIDRVVVLYHDLKEQRRLIETKQARLNVIAREFKGADEAKRALLQNEGAELRKSVTDLGVAIKQLEAEYFTEMLKVPNMASPETPAGLDDTGNIPLRTVGTPREFGFKPCDHVEIGERLDILDFARATRVTGPKFYFLKKAGVLFELALTQYALHLAMRHGFSPMITPDLARNDMITASGFTPRGPESQVYAIEGTELGLIGTSEITLGGYMADSVLLEEELPIKLAGISHCFRTEAGGGGRVSKGLYRVHQFTKVELYQFAHPDKSGQAHEEMLAIEEEFYRSLGLPYRVVNICAGDLGGPAYKKYDIEAWMPFIGEGGGYGEVTSASNCTDFQARRLNVRFRDASGKKRYVHTLNGTVVAVTRTMLALLENNQQQNGSVVIPTVLQPYMGMEVIEPK